MIIKRKRRINYLNKYLANYMADLKRYNNINKCIILLKKNHFISKYKVWNLKNIVILKHIKINLAYYFNRSFEIFITTSLLLIKGLIIILIFMLIIKISIILISKKIIFILLGRYIIILAKLWSLLS